MDQHLTRTLTKIFMAGLKAVDPEEAVRRHVELSGDRLRVGEHVYPLDSFKRIIVTGAGKGTAPMARALEDILGERLTTGWIIVKYGHGLPLKKIAVFEAGHPVPDQAGLDATRFILAELAKCTAENLVIGAFSGGGSALTPAPRPPVSFAEKQQTTQLLLDSGATIDELNTLRKHLSIFKGGQLAQIAYPATVAALFLSDVVGDPLDVIASGPTVPDPGTFADCLAIVARHGLEDLLPAAVVQLLRDGGRAIFPILPRPATRCSGRFKTWWWGVTEPPSWRRREAGQLGYHVLILSSFLQGEASAVAGVLAGIGKEIVMSDNPIPAPACILAGGETTVRIRGRGQGGRNQELALAAAIAVAGWPHIALLSAGTDGTDGPTDAAGAMIDGDTCRQARKLGLNPGDYLADNDSYHFFDQLGLLLKTGPTRTNVMDLMCLLVDKRSSHR